MTADESKPEGPVTLTIDIGGTGIKMLRLDAEGTPLGDRSRELTPHPALPGPVQEVITEMLSARAAYDRISVGFPGVVVRGIVQTAPNLDTEAWRGTDLQQTIETLAGKPVRVINDADLQGYGVIHGHGVELVLTLGTGLGTALFSDGHLVANLELAHHPYGDGKTYEERVSDEACHILGPTAFTDRVLEMLAQLRPILNYETLHLGGGNVRHLEKERLPDDVDLFDNVAGMRGGVNLWHDLSS